MQIICEDVSFVCVKLVIYTALCTVLNYNFFLCRDSLWCEIYISLIALLTQFTQECIKIYVTLRGCL